MTIEEIKDKFSQKGYQLLSTDYQNNKTPLIFEKDGYKYFNTYNGFIKTDNPKKWGVNNPFSIDNLKWYLSQSGAECTVISKQYDANNVQLKCCCGNVYHVSWNNLIVKKQYVCPSCSARHAALKHRKDEKYLNIIANKKLQLLDEYEGCKKFYYFMTKDGYYIKTSPYNLLQGSNERDTIFDISNKYTINNMRHYLLINELNLELLDNQYIGTKANYRFRCACGNEFVANWQWFLRGVGIKCPRCSHKQSSLECKIEDWLIEQDITYEKQKVFSDCFDIAPLRFDFYLTKYNMVIEADGEQHFRPVNFGGISDKEALENFYSTTRKDDIKNKYCLKNNINILRIAYSAFVTDEYKYILQTSIS